MRSSRVAFEISIAQSAEAMEAHGPSEGVAGFALVQLCSRLPAQNRIVQPVEGEEGAFERPDFAQRQCEPVLPRIGTDPRKGRNESSVAALHVPDPRSWLKRWRPADRSGGRSRRCRSSALSA